MKILKFIVFFAILVTLSGCSLYHDENRGLTFKYRLWLSFRDASGNDLVDGVKMSLGEGYSLNEGITAGEATFGEIACELFDRKDIILESSHTVGTRYATNVVKWHDYYYLMFEYSFFSNNSHAPETILVKLHCPHIFGDLGEQDEILNYWKNEILTYWKPEHKNSKYYACYRIEFNGKELTGITYESRLQASVATVTLEK